MSADALRVRELGVSLGGQRILEGITAEAPAGAVTVVVGPSGSGKSTLLKAVAGLVPARGVVQVGGCVLGDAPPERRGVGLVFQDGRLFPFLDVAGNVAFGLRERRHPRALARVREVLALCRAEHLAGRDIATLSGGERQRVALARALAPEPGVLLLDEPWSALDATLRGEVAGELLAAVRASGTTAVVVTHDRQEAQSLADHLWLLSEGRLLQQGDPVSCYRDPVTVEAARLLGDAMAWPLDDDGGVDGVDVPRVRPDASGVPHAVLRPEEIGPAPRGWRVEILDAAFLGGRWRMRGAIGSRQVQWWADEPDEGAVILAPGQDRLASDLTNSYATNDPAE